jgi:four helix bundle protein
MPDRIYEFQDLRVYRTAFDWQQRIFEWTKCLPSEERYGLSSQVRRSSRSVGANIAEAWQKRRYPAHFVSKLSDADAELAETRHWLLTARACDYISQEEHDYLQSAAASVGRLLGGMIHSPTRWRIRRPPAMSQPE